MPLALTLLAAAASLAAMLTVGTLTALATLLPTREATWRSGARLSGVAAAAWAAVTLALVVVSAPAPEGAALADAATGAAIARFAIGDGAPLTASAAAAALVATASLVGLRRPLGAACLLVAAAAAAAPLAALVAGRLTGWALVQAGAPPGALAGDDGEGLAVLAGSPGATMQIAVWLLLLATGAWLGGGLAVRLAGPPAGDAAPVRHRVRYLGTWAAAVGALSLAAGTAAAATISEVTVPQALPPLAAGTVAVTGALPAPLPLTPWRALTRTSPDLLWLLVAACAVAAYLLAVRRHRRRVSTASVAGVAWPRGRTAAWVAGCSLLAWVTSGGLAAYTSLLLSAQLLAHATLLVAVAPLLAAGAPIALLRATGPPRQDGSAGLRECADAVAATRVAAATRHPAVALALAGVVLGALWAGAALPLALGTLAGHELAVAAVLGCALLLTRSASPSPQGSTGLPGPLGPRPPALAGGRRVLLVAGSVAAAAAAACGWLAASDRLLAAGWFTGLGLGVDALADQRAGALAAGVVVVVGCSAVSAWSAGALAAGRRRRG